MVSVLCDIVWHAVLCIRPIHICVRPRHCISSVDVANNVILCFVLVHLVGCSPHHNEKQLFSQDRIGMAWFRVSDKMIIIAAAAAAATAMASVAIDKNVFLILCAMDGERIRIYMANVHI